MGILNGKIIQKPVSIDDVRRVLGAGSRDLGTLCKHSSINKWSKYKPCSYSGMNTNITKLQGANYGLGGFMYWQRMGLLESFMRGTVNSTTSPANGEILVEQFPYTKPSGGANSPYRLTDFENYNHDAQSPIGELTDTEVTLDSQNRCHFSIRYGEMSDDTISLSDLKFGSTVGTNMYLNMMLLGSSDTYYMGSTWKIGDEGMWGGVITFTGVPAGNYKLLPFLSTVSIASTTKSAPTTTGVFVPLYEAPKDVTIKANAVNAVITFGAVNKDQLFASKGTVNYNFKITNNGSTPISTDSVLMYMENDSNIPLGVNYSYQSGNSNIAAKATKEYSGSWTDTNFKNKTLYFKVVATLNGQQITGTTKVLEYGEKSREL